MKNNRNRFGRSGKSGIAGISSISPTMQKMQQQGSLYTRGQVLRGFGLGAAGVAAAGLLGSGVARATGTQLNENIVVQANGDIWVYPVGSKAETCSVPNAGHLSVNNLLPATSNVTQDVKNVYDAVELSQQHNKTVILKAAKLDGSSCEFNFGDYSNGFNSNNPNSPLPPPFNYIYYGVPITKEVTIMGEEPTETDPESGKLIPKTKIVGGNTSFAVVGSLPGEAQLKVVIQDIHVKKPTFMAFNAYRHADITLDGLWVTDVVPINQTGTPRSFAVGSHNAGRFVVENCMFSYSGLRFSTAIWHNPWGGQWNLKTDVIIKDNYISVDNLENDQAFGNVVPSGYDAFGQYAMGIGGVNLAGPTNSGSSHSIENNVCHVQSGMFIAGLNNKLEIYDNEMTVQGVGMWLATGSSPAYSNNTNLIDNNRIHFDGSRPSMWLNAAIISGMALFFGLPLFSGTVTRNTITGNAAFGIMGGSMTFSDNISNSDFFGNDLLGLHALIQVYLSPTSHNNYFGPDELNGIPGDVYGSAGVAGVMCMGKDNWFEGVHFIGPYSGWEPYANGPGLFWFTNTSENNMVVATKLNGPPHGFDLCCQIWDQPGTNKIPGYRRCANKSAEFIQAMQNLKAEIEAKHAEMEAELSNLEEMQIP